MENDQSFLDQVLQTFGYVDVYDHIGNAVNDVAGDTYADANELFSVNDQIIGQIDTAIGAINDLISSGALQTTVDIAKGLNFLHSANSGLKKLQSYLTNLNTARDANELTGGLALIGNTAGSASDLIGFASAALAGIATLVGPEVVIPAVLASAGLSALSNTLGAIQNLTKDFSQIVEAVDNAINHVNSNPGGGPVTIYPPSGGSGGSSGGSGGSSGSGDTGNHGGVGGNPDAAPIQPLTIDVGKTWPDLTIDPSQHESLRNSKYAPPPQDDPAEQSHETGDSGDTGNSGDTGGTGGTGGSGGGGGGSGGGSRRHEGLEDLFRNPPGGPGSDGPSGSSDGPSGYGPSGPTGGDKVKQDPLVLDLDGDGIELTQVGAPPVYFDADGDGIAVLTGWVDPDDGLLARDLDGNGLIETQAELFGTNTVDAISDLATLDSNHDGQINADDIDWSTLYVWRDLNQDGMSSANELQTLDEAGLLSISLNQQISGRVEGDNLIHSTTTYETVSGEIGGAAAVLFGVNTLFNQTAQPIVFETGSPFLDIPNVKGYGTLADLRVAAYNDPDLLSMVQALVADAETLTGGEFQTRFEAIALRWAGVEAVDPGNDPFGPNLQHEAFLEAFRGVERPEISGARALDSAEDSYFSALSSLALRFGIELATSQLGEASTSEDINAAIDSPFFALTFASASPGAGIVNGGLERIIYEIATRLPDDVDAAIAKLDKVMPFLAAFRDEYFLEEGERLDTTFKNEDFDSFVLATLSQYIDNPTLVNFAFSALNSPAHFLGTAGDDTATVEISWYMLSFSRSLLADLGAGDDTLDVNAPDSFSDNWGMSYIYRDGDGTDTIDISDARGPHRLFLTDITSDQVGLARAPNSVDGIVTLYNGATITFVGLYPAIDSGLHHELTIYTADGVEIASSGTATGGLFVSTAADEDFTGTALLADNYYYATGDGADTIFDSFANNDSSSDKLVFGDINKSDLIIAADGSDLVLTFANGQPGDSVRLVGQLAPNGFFSIDPAYKIEKFQFADGEIVSAQDLVDMYIAGQSTGGDDTITGLLFEDLIPLSDGTDTASGGNNGDTYVRGDSVTGTTTIEDNGPTGTDTLVIEGFARGDASFARNGDDVVIALPNGSVILKNQLAANTDDVIEQIVFSDGPVGATELTAILAPSNGSFTDLTGTAAAETLSGTSADERVDGLEGDDILNGRGGSDIYVFGSGSGNDTIIETGDPGSVSVDRVQFTDIASSDVSLTRAGNDLIVEVLATGQTLTVDRQFFSETNGIEYFEFADGIVWNRSEIETNSYIFGTSGNDTVNGTSDSDNILGLEGNDNLRGSSGDDVYIFRSGDGQDVITDARFGNDASVVNTVRLVDTNFEDLRIDLVNNNGSISDILLRYGADDTILLENAFATDDFADNRPIQRVELADGTVLTDQDLINLGVVHGTDGDDVIRGAVRIDGLAGDDTITTFGQDTDFIWRTGSGNDTILHRAFDGGSGSLIMEGLNRDDVTFSRNGQDMVITNNATGETVTVQYQFQSVLGGRKAGVNEVVFEDGTYGRNAVANASLVPATSGDDVITGGYDSEFFQGLGGDDVLDGGQGSDAYVWQKGDGNDTIYDYSNGSADTDVLYLTDVESAADIQLSRPGGTSYDLQITVTETGETITLANQLGYGYDGLERIEFANGSSLSLEGIAHVIPFVDEAGAGALEGDYLDNILQGGLGDDTLNGKQGADTYVWSRGDGNDTIAETDLEYVYDETGGEEGEGDYVEVIAPVESTGDTLRLVGVRSSEVTFERPAGSDDLVITVIDTGEAITVSNQFLETFSGIERIVFEDDIFGRADIHDGVGGENISGDGTDQTLVGGLGPDVFTLTGGNETVQTGGGRDTIIIGANGGVDRIEGFNRGVEGTTIVLTDNPFADFDALLAAASDTSEGVLIDLGGGNQILIDGLVVSDLEPEDFGFDRPAIVGTDLQDDIFGTLLDDTIFLFDGDDFVQGQGGDDDIDAGDGRDVVFYSGSSEDFVVVRNGNQVTVTDTNPDDGDEGTDTIVNAEVLSFLGDQVVMSIANQAPVAATDGNSAAGAEDAPITGALPAATDPDGDTNLTYALSGAALAGLVLNPDGSFAYQPPADFNGTVSFDYVVSDPSGETSEPATFTLEVTPVNDAPVLANALADRTVDEAETISFTLPSDAFFDVDGDSLAMSADLANGDPLPQWLGFDAATRTFSGTPPSNASDTLEVRVTASDGTLSASDVFTLEILATNQAPEAVDDNGLETGQDAPLTIAVADLLANDTDADGDMLSIVSVFDAQNGSVELVGSTVVFTPDSGFSGGASFQYTVSDGSLEASATVSLNVVDPYADFLQGSQGRDYLLGDPFSQNDIYGAGGNDVIVGGNHDDHLAGGSGNDRLYSRGGDDVIEGGDGKDRLFGSSGDDVLIGGDGNDRLYGGKGDDFLDGGGGNDRLYGSAGEDVFVFKDGYGHDRIYGFDKGNRPGSHRENDDVIFLDVEGIDCFEDLLGAVSSSGRHVEFDFGGGDTLTLVDTRLHKLSDADFDFI